MKKIDKQRHDYLNNIDFTDWIKETKDDQRKRFYYYQSIEKTFEQYHDVMFDYYTVKNNETFVKKWWFRVRHPNLQGNVPLVENIITRQRATFTIDYDAASTIIINDVKDNMYRVFTSIKQ